MEKSDKIRGKIRERGVCRIGRTGPLFLKEDKKSRGKDSVVDLDNTLISSSNGMGVSRTQQDILVIIY